MSDDAPSNDPAKEDVVENTVVDLPGPHLGTASREAEHKPRTERSGKRESPSTSPRQLDQAHGVAAVQLDIPSVFDAGHRRFSFEGQIGHGGTSRVFAAFDHDLEREIAIKVVEGSQNETSQNFVREARVTSRLTHPNVPPVYDIGDLNGAHYLTMPRVRGRSLLDCIREAKRLGRSSALPPNELVEVLLKVLDALAYAHDRNVLHKDIKPANIMLGLYGEVMLLDWGTASTLGQNSEGDSRMVSGTPTYMAPEQALGREEDPRIDVYALGATLFHALLLRKPLLERDSQCFWKRKVAGDLDVPTPEELARVSRPLLGIARRALEADPDERYASVQEMAAALRDYSSGGVGWSAPIIEDDFRGEDWSTHWVPVEDGSFRQEVSAKDGALCSVADEGALLFYTKRLGGGIAVEYDASIAPGALPGDISLVWTDEDVFRDGKPHWPRQGGRSYCFQVGALSNHLVGIFRDFHQPLATQAWAVEVGRPLRVRAEVDERMLRLFIDDEMVAEYEENLPLRSGYIALYSYFPGKRFSRVRVHQKGLPENVSPLAVGDAFFTRELFEDAEREYFRVELGQVSPELAEEARYKRGLCHLKRGAWDDAFDLWRELSQDHWQPRIEMHRAEHAFERGRHEEAICIMAQVLEEHPSTRRRVVQLWTDLVGRSVGHDDTHLGDYLRLRDDHFAHEPTSRSVAARALLALGQFERVAGEFSAERIEFCDALLALGRFDRVIEDHGDMTGLRDATLVRQGRLAEVSHEERSQPTVLIVRGRAREAAELSDMAPVVLAAGQYERVLELPDASALERVTALVRLERLDEALATGHPLAFLAAGRPQEALARATTLEFRVRALHQLCIEAFVSGDAAGFFGYRDEVLSLPFSFAWEDMWCPRYLLIPLCASLLGSGLDGSAGNALHDSLRSVVARLKHYWCGRAYHVADCVLRGEEQGSGGAADAAFFRQPARGGGAARFALARALRAELYGGQETAVRAYQDFLEIPEPERQVDSLYLHPEVAVFAQGRRTSLG